MFSLPREIKFHLFSFLDNLDAMSLVSKKNREIVLEKYKKEIKNKYQFDVKDNKNVIPLYKKLKSERERVINFLTLSQTSKIKNKSSMLGFPRDFTLERELYGKIEANPFCVSEILKSVANEDEVRKLKQFYNHVMDKVFLVLSSKEKSAQEVLNRAILLDLIKEHKVNIYLKNWRDIFKEIKNIKFDASLSTYVQTPEGLKEMGEAEALLQMLSSLCLVNAQELVKILIKNNPDMVACDFSDKYFTSLFHAAVISCRLPLVKVLIEANADINRNYGYKVVDCNFEQRNITAPICYAFEKMFTADNKQFLDNKTLIEMLLKQDVDLGATIDYTMWVPSFDGYSIAQHCELFLSGEEQLFSRVPLRFEQKELLLRLLTYAQTKEDERRMHP